MRTKLKSSTTTDRLPPVTPGEILLEDFLKPLHLSANALALQLRVPATRIQAILRGKRAITADTALRLARYFGTTAELWMNLQQLYELDVARRERLVEIEEQVPKRVQH